MAGHRHSRRSHKLPASPPLSFVSAFKLLFLLSFLVSLPIACLYLYPLLPPPFSSSIPLLWTSTTSWLTPPFLFLLLNLVVCSLVASSGFLTRPHHHPHLPHSPPGRGGSARDPQPLGKAAHEELGSNARPKASFAPRTIPVPQRSHAHRPHNEHRSHIEQPTPGDGKPVGTLVETLGRSKSGQALGKGKAKSDQPPLQVPKRTQTSLQTASANAMPGDAQVESSDADEELDDVDKRADEYIAQFYQKMKLQRIDSLMRYRGSSGRSH